MKNLNLIIVEDEPAILQGIIMLVKRIDLPLCITGTYTNGQEALDDLSRARPDIVMTDVQMPVMSGLQLVEHMKSIGYPAEYLILSGYAEFEYAQTALTLGVHHYLLKSPRISELREALSSLCDTIFKSQYDKYRLYFQDLLFQQFHPHENIPTTQDMNLQIFLYTLGPLLEKLPEESDAYLSHISKSKTLQMLNTEFPKSYQHIWILNSYYPNTKIIIAANPEEYGLTSNKLYEFLKQQTYTSNMAITLTVLPLPENNQSFRDAFLFATKYLQKFIQFGKNQLLYALPGKATIITDTLLPTERDMLSKALTSQRVESVIEQYRYFTKSWMKESLSQVECTSLTRRCLTEVCCSISSSKNSFEENALRETALNELFHITTRATSYDEFFDNCCQLIENILTNSNCFLGDNQIDDIVESLYQHILANFSKDIDVNAFAKNHGYHPIYLITQFTKIKKLSPTKMIISLRITRAKELLLSTDMNLKDIADAIGYCDVSYFSRLFKEREGISPGTYRKTERS